jgi:hypothetical protein
VDFIRYNESTPVSGASYTMAPAAPTGKLGDANGNGTVTSTDALLALSADAGMSIPSQYCPMTCADVNKDGKVGSTDALIILTYDAGLSTGSFPVGTGSCPTTVTKPTGCP